MGSQDTAQLSHDPTIAHALAELTRDACLVMDTDAVILVANEEAARIYGYLAEELVGMHISRLCAEGFGRALCEQLPHARGTGLLFTSTHMRKDGIPFPVEVSWKQGPAGRRELLVAHVRDISEQLQLESDLRLRSDTLDAALDAIIVHDLDGNLLLANSAAAARAGLSHDDFMRLGPWEWIAERGRDRIHEHLVLLRQQGALVFESQDTRSDGSAYPVEVHARLMRLGKGTVVVSVIRDITERAQAMEAMRRMALSDPLTGLANRAHLVDVLQRATADARRHGDILGVLFLDLDDFKPINDRLGHAAGDQVLVDLARRLQTEVRVTDTVARMGGDEFAIVLPRLASVEALATTARKIAACTATPVDFSGESVSVTTSIGAAHFDPVTDSADTLLAKADSAMYEAKRSGVVWRVWGEEL